MIKHIFFLLFIVVCNCTVYSQGDIFKNANEAYNKSEYNTAIEFYNEILSSGKSSPELYLNLGNAYLKQNRLGEAILNFEKGLKLNSKHEALNQNLHLANKQVPTQITFIPDFFLKRYWDNVVNVWSAKSWGIIQILLLILVVLFAARWLLSSQLKTKKLSFYSLVATVMFFVLSMIWGMQKLKLERDSNYAIVTTNESVLRITASESSDLINSLSEGVKLKLLDKIENYYKVQLLDKEVGWILENEISLI